MTAFCAVAASLGLIGAGIGVLRGVKSTDDLQLWAFAVIITLSALLVTSFRHR